MQDIERIPAELKELYRTAWEVPMRSLIDMAAERGAFIDQSQSLNLFMEIADHRQAHLDVPARVEAGPEDHVLPALPPGHPHQPDHRPADGADPDADDAPTVAGELAPVKPARRPPSRSTRRRGHRLLAREPRSPARRAD